TTRTRSPPSETCASRCRRRESIMAVRDILSIGHPLLRQPGRTLSLREIRSAEIQQLIDDLIDTMRAANGAGIAAHQIGTPVRVAAMEVTHNPRYPYKPPIPLTIAINP